MSENTVHIAFICDNNYVLPTSVAITSLIENKLKNTKYEISIVTADLSEENSSFFKGFSKDNVIVNIIPASAEKYLGMHKNSKDSYCVASIAALLKFDLPNMITNIDKLLYLDGDIIINQDLSELYNVELGENYAAVVRDSGMIYSQNKERRKFTKYFNSGVMVLNLEALRKNNVSELLIETKRNSNDMSLMDQNVFNAVFDGKTKLLPIKYNLLYINLLRASSQNKFSMENLNEFFGTSYNSLQEVKNEAVILHYSSKDKPWKFYNVPTIEIWDKYYSLSPFGKNKLNRKKVKVEKDPKTIIGKSILTLKKKGPREFLRKTMGFMRKRKALKIFVLPYDGLRWTKNKLNLLRLLMPKFDGLNTTEIRDKKIIVSFTTMPKRINAACIVIGTMLRQTKKPDKIKLYLGEEHFKNVKLPIWLRWQMRCGVEVIYCKDLKPHTKYFYAMKDNPNDIIITIDDDIIYYNDIIELLYNSHIKHPNAIPTLRTHLMTFDKEGKLNPYNVWRQRWSKLIDVPTIKLFATGVGGVLYPPHLMHKDLLKEDVFMELCPIADDLWLKIMQLLENVPCVLPAPQRPLRYIDGTQDVALWRTNVGRSQNDDQLEKLFNKYNDYYGTEDTLLDRIKNDKTPIRNI